jgi:hypothetical protein
VHPSCYYFDKNALLLGVIITRFHHEPGIGAFGLIRWSLAIKRSRVFESFAAATWRRKFRTLRRRCCLRRWSLSF